MKSLLYIICLSIILYIWVFILKQVEIESFFNGSKWHLYAIGDLYYYDKKLQKPNYGKRMERDILRGKYHGSLAYLYYHRCKKQHDKETLYKLIRRYPFKFSPGEKDLVMHIRIGDIKENMRDSWKKWYTYDENKYNSLQKIIAKEGIKKVVLVCGSHKNYNNFDKSNEFLDKVKVKIGKGVLVEVRDNYSPDEDLVYMSRSHYFIPSVGQFSRIVVDMVETSGGKVILLNSNK